MDEGQPQVLLERLMGKLRDSPTAVLRMERGSARYEETPVDGLRVEAVEEVSSSRQTNPISDGDEAGQVLSPAGVTDDPSSNRPGKTNPSSPRGTGIPSAGRSGQALPVNEDHRQDADATIPPDGGTTNLAEARSGLYETNPICAVPRSTGIPSAAFSGQALPVSLKHGRDAHAIAPGAPDQSRQTNPICGGAAQEQDLCGTGVKSDPAPSGPGETKPISARASREQFGYRPIFRRRR